MLQSILNSKSGFNNSLHGFRGIAALMVYLGHSVNGYREHLCSGCSAAPVMEQFYFLGAYGVEVFFFLSGYVIFSASLKVDSKNFISHRFWRIYPVFLLFTILFFVLNHFLQKWPEKDSLMALLANITFIDRFVDTKPLSPNAWSITFEVWYYIMTFTLLRPLIVRKHYILSFLALGLWCYFIVKFPITLYYILGVLINIGLRKYQSRLSYMPDFAANIIQWLALGLVIWLAFVDDYTYKWHVLVESPEIWLLMLALTTFMAFLFHPASIIARWLCAAPLMSLGTVSYTLYLAHPYSYLVARMLSQKLVEAGMDFSLVTVIYIVTNILLTVTLVVAVHNWVEKACYKKGTGKDIYTPSV